jgi:TolA-binding protein
MQYFFVRPFCRQSLRTSVETIVYKLLILVMAIGSLSQATALNAQDTESIESARPALRGSLVEDRAARKLIDAGDARLDAEESTKALEIWKSVIERYPRSRVRFTAHIRLGKYYLDRERAYDRARTHFEAVTTEDNRDDAQRAEAMLNVGICHYWSRLYGKCFQVMRDVIEEFPVSPEVNQAYYYIGLGHFQQGHYSRAITALEKVGTTLTAEDSNNEKLEAAKRFFVKVEDADLAVLTSEDSVDVICKSSGGDQETVQCFPIGRNVRIVLGSIPTKLGVPVPGNGVLEVKGGDTVDILYTDAHTADKTINVEVLSTVTVVGDGIVQIKDGAFVETIKGVVLGKTVNVEVVDADRDISAGADQVQATVSIYRRKTDEEIETETADLIAKQEIPTDDEAAKALVDVEDLAMFDEEEKIDRFKLIEQFPVTLTEVVVQRELSTRFNLSQESDTDEGDDSKQNPDGAPAPTAEPAPAVSSAIHSGVFRATVSVIRSDASISDQVLQALPSDQVRVTYEDKLNTGEGIAVLTTSGRCLEGNIGGVRVTRALISDQALRVQTQLKTADALTRIGNRYKEFGLEKKADEKYKLALSICEDMMSEVQRLRGRLLEETYVQLWHIYFEMDRLNLASAMCARLQREFPSSGFVDDALLQLADVARVEGDLNRAIGIYTRLVNMKTSQLRGEAQFGIAECFESMAVAQTNEAAVAQLQDRAFQEFKKVYDQFPESGRVGEAVAKMADHYYQQKDYARAIDTFETVLDSHPDARFLDVILFNYGRCLFRMDRQGPARQRFEQLIADFPESQLAPDAKKIAEALKAAGF